MQPNRVLLAAGRIAMAGFIACWASILSRSTESLLITEVMTSNDGTLRDDFGEYSDWIELHNASAQTRDLNGYFLTDDAADPRKWKFPEFRMEAGEYSIVFASGADRAIPGEPLHTNFRLSSSGEYLGLVAPDGVSIVQEFTPLPPAQASDVSYGLAVEELKGGVVVSDGTPSRILIPTNDIGLDWTRVNYDDGGWLAASVPAKYSRSRPGTVFDDILGADLESVMYGENPSAYIRIPFSLTDASGFTEFQLAISYDDGFVAYLNGRRIAEDRAPELLEWNSAAVVPRTRDLDPLNIRIDLRDRLNLLRSGENVLAIHALNRNEFDIDFLIAPEMTVRDARVIPDAYRFFPRPTPGFSNIGGLPGTSGGVRFSAVTSTFVRPLQLTLEPTARVPGTMIRYTLDGATPTEDSPAYSDPIRVFNTVQVRARAFAPGFLAGPLGSETFIRLNPDISDFTSDLPIVVIHTLGAGTIVEGSERAGILTVHEPVHGRSSVSAPPDLVTRAAFRRRGSSTAGQPKPNYAVEFWDENDQARDAALLGMPPESDWVFHAPYNFDPALIRNPLALEMSSRLGRYAPRYRFVEVFVNSSSSGGSLASSHYAGVYNILEKIKRGKDRVDLDELRPGDSEEPEITGGYILKIDRVDPGDSGFSAGGRAVAYVDPKEDEIQSLERDPQEKYIAAYLNQFWTALRSASFTDPVRGYAPFIDASSWIDQHIVDTITFNVDALRLSSYFRKPRKGPLVYGPVWDYDRSLGSTDGRDTNPSVWGSGFFTDLWWSRLFRDPEFWQMWIDRWQEARGAQLSDRNLNALIDSFAARVEESAERDFTRWRQTKRGRSQAGEIAHLKSWLAARSTFMDTNLISRPLFSRASGHFGPQFSLHMIAPVGATVYYTLDGSDPRRFGGRISPSALVYRGPIGFETDSHVKARARNPDFTPRRFGDGPPIVSPWSGITTARFSANRPARAGDLAVTEIQYNPAPPAQSGLEAVPGAKNDDFEFIELKNISDATINLVGVRFNSGIQFGFTDGVVQPLRPAETVLLVSNRSAFTARYGSKTPIAGEYEGRLGNAGERLQLLAEDRSKILDFSYGDNWYPATDGHGFSLVLSASGTELNELGNASNWRASAHRHGSPGSDDPVPPELPRVVVNEAFVFGDDSDAVELHNLEARVADIGGWFLTDDRNDLRKFRIPNGVSIPPNGFWVFDEDDFNSDSSTGKRFSFSRFGDQVYLFSADETGGLSGYAHGFVFGAAERDASFGRQLTRAGEERFVIQTSETLNQANSGPAVGPIVINEIMYRPPDILDNGDYWDNPEDEYVELRNGTAESIDLFEASNHDNVWTLRGGVDFDFPAGTSVPGGGYLLLANFDPNSEPDRLSDFRARYSVPADVPVFGPYRGKLNNGSATLRLLKPGEPDEQTEPRVLVDRIDYSDQSPWPIAADGMGHSLQRVDGSEYGNDAANWRSANPSAGEPNQTGAAPAIVTQPVAITALEGGDARFGVSAAGDGPLRYQWRFQGRNLPQETGPALTVPKVDPDNAGDYRVVVFNASGSTASQTASLTLTPLPSIIEHPVGQNVTPGESATLGVTVRAPGRLNYQWRFNGVDIPGATDAMLALDNLQLEDSGDYSVSVGDGTGSVVSRPARLNVLVGPMITEQPHSRVALIGETVSFKVGATGTLPLTYRWRKGTRDVQSGFESVLTIRGVQSSDAGTYSVFVTNIASRARGVAGPFDLIVLEDFDQDRIADLWEVQYRLSSNSVTDARLDLDGDGYSNIEEYLADTNPRDPESVLRFESVSVEPDATVLEFLGRTNRFYSIQYSDALGNGVWQSLTNISVRTENQVQRVFDPTAGRENRFYRLTVPPNR